MFTPADHVETLVAKVADLYRDAEAQLLRRMAESIARGIDSPQWAEQQLLNIRRYRAEAEKVLATLQRQAATAGHDAVYLAAARGQAGALAELGRKLTPEEITAVPVDTHAVLRVAQELTGTLSGAGSPILRVVDDAYRQVVAKATPSATLGAITRREAAQQALDEFAQRGVTSYVGRTGRQWRIESYVEAVTRSATMNAAVQGHVDRIGASDVPLAVVSDVPQECEKCRPWEGKTLALRNDHIDYIVDGKRPRIAGTLAEARSAGLFHPGCRHSLSQWRPNLRSFGETADPEGDKARQRLRALERQVRAAKREELVALDEQAAKAARAKAAAAQAKIREHVATTSAKRQRQREQIGSAL